MKQVGAGMIVGVSLLAVAVGTAVGMLVMGFCLMAGGADARLQIQGVRAELPTNGWPLLMAAMSASAVRSRGRFDGILKRMGRPARVGGWISTLLAAATGCVLGLIFAHMVSARPDLAHQPASDSARSMWGGAAALLPPLFAGLTVQSIIRNR